MVVGALSEAADVGSSVSSKVFQLIHTPYRTYQDGVGNHCRGTTASAAADEEAAPKCAETRSAEGGEARA